jgi:hypothetical protein
MLTTPASRGTGTRTRNCNCPHRMTSHPAANRYLTSYNKARLRPPQAEDHLD